MNQEFRIPSRAGQGKNLIITVFGNPVEEKDNLVVRMVPELKKRFPKIDFQIMDPTENLEPPSDPWIILDAGMGIDDVVVVEDLDKLERVPGQSVHDFDVYMELRLREKLGQLPKMKIIIVPVEMDRNDCLDKITSTIGRML